MILLPSLDPVPVAHDPLYPFLPLAIAGLFTAAIFAVQWFAGLFSDRDKSSEQDHSISKGAVR
ncbi:MAG: hypothetical protein WBR26_25160 [Candidatus Acidiferrum sp.]|jgi:hypothetical protein